MLNVMIADDQEGMRLLLRKALNSIDDVAILAETKNVDETVEMVTKLKPHAIFLDIEMEGQSGIDAANQIIDIDPKCMIVFVTAFQEYMPQAFELYAFDYIVKPFKIERLIETVKRMQSVQSNEQKPISIQNDYNEAILIKEKDGISMVSPNEIILIQRENRNTVIITETKKYSTHETLSDIEFKLPPGQFLRCHKSYIIQINKILSITVFGRWTYLVKLKGIREDALLTRDKALSLEQAYKIKIG